MEDGSSSSTPSVKSSSKTRQKGSPVSNENKNNGRKLKKQVVITFFLNPHIKPINFLFKGLDFDLCSLKGTVASAANRTKSDSRMSKDVVKPSEKPKPSVCKEITSKADVSLVSGKRITTKTASNKRSDQVQSHRQRREVQSSATVLDHASLTKSKIVSLSSGIRGGPPKTRSTPKSLSDRLPATSSVLTRSAQEDHLRSSKEMTTISHLRKFSVDNRICDGFGQRSLGLSGHHILPKSRESESQRPKVVLKNLPDRDKSNQNTGLERRSISSVKGRRQKKGLDEIDARIGPKSDPSKGTGSQRTSNLKPVNKVKNYLVSHRYAYSFLFLLRS
ncbi:hypothetical protein NC652_031539 [Populus alba x Populus x berolinensis]|nr:hypothetical protein NC652_031539 [Populus alba x Populus x berolinensis]